jgi:outer membrane protein
MRKFLTVAVAAAGLAMAGSPQLSAQVATAGKIGYINSQRVIQEAPGAAEARSTLEKEVSASQAQIKAMDDSMATMLQQYNQQSVMLSADAKKQKEDELRTKQGAFQQRAQQLEDAFSQRQQQLMKPIMDKIQAAITELRQAEGYAIIFDMASQAMVADDPALDLTDKVIARLKAATPTAAAK